MRTKLSASKDGPIGWSVLEPVGNVVLMEFTLRNNYEAIEFAEHMAQAMRNGNLTLELNSDEQTR